MKTLFIILISTWIIGCKDTTDLQSQLAQVSLDYKQKFRSIRLNDQRTSVLIEEEKQLKECLDKEADFNADHFVYNERDIQIKKNTACYKAGVIRLEKVLEEQKKK